MAVTEADGTRAPGTLSLVPELDGSQVVVIGGAGFIGSHLVDQLLARDVAGVTVFDNFIRGKRENLSASQGDSRLRIVEGTVTDREALAAVVEGADYVFHLAALWLFECVHEPRAAVEVNVEGTFNVIEAVQKAAVKKTVYSSSASVYGDAVTTPMSEDHPFNNRTFYGATKIAGEQMFRAYNEQHGFDYVGLRYMNVYGPRMDERGTYVSVIVKVLDKIARGERPSIFGDGSQAYDFVHVEDVARANIAALESDATDAFYNVGTGVQTTISELVASLIKLSGSTIEPEYLPQEQMFVTNRVGDPRLARADLGFEASIELDTGLRSVLEWRYATTAATQA
jgi:UDP-glucose 4-epimerase